MLQLRDLIIQRVDEARTLSDKQQPRHVPGTLESQFQMNRWRLKQFSKAKKRQKERMLDEKELLEEIRSLRFWHSQTVENFYVASLDIFSRYDSRFLSLPAEGVSTAQKLGHLYSTFFEKEHARVSAGQLLSVVRGDITESSPFTLLSWVCEWSRSQLTQRLQAAINNEFDRHEQEMRNISISRDKVIVGHKDKQKYVNPLCISSHMAGQRENTPPKVVFTNKESVFGLFHEELLHYYRGSPLELDLNFLKSIRKVHGKGNQLQNMDNLDRAVNILIESKNKKTKGQVQKYRYDYFSRFPKKLLRTQSKQDHRELLPGISVKKTKKEPIESGRFFQRIKSESKDEQSPSTKCTYQNKKSLLLCPKPNEISFESSKRIITKIQKERRRGELQLPEIMQNKKSPCHPKSSMVRSKPVTGLLASACPSEQKKWDQLSPKFYEFKQSKSIERVARKNNYSCTNETKLEMFQNPEKIVRKIDGDQLKRNRKLMLQLLRQKNRYAFLEK